MAALDIERHDALAAWLAEAGHVPEPAAVRCRTLAGGVSNRTVLVELPDGRAWVLKQALAKLRVADDWYSDVARIRREAEGLRWLARLAPPGSTTPLVFEAPAEHLLAMQAVPTPHENYKTLLLAGRLDRATTLGLATQFGRLLGVVHAHAAKAPGVAAAFEDRSFFESLRLEPYYAASAAREPRAADFYASLVTDCRADRYTLVHGDYSPKNVLVREGRLVLLDHEVIHFGDGSFDLGFALTHLLGKAHHVEARRGDYRDAALAFWDAYRADAGTSLDLREGRCVRHTLGCLLARVVGKSLLEYLTPEQRHRQREAAVSLMSTPPRSVPELVDAFLRLVSERPG